MLYEFLCQGKMLNGNLLNQFPQFSLDGFLLHTVSALYPRDVNDLTPMALKINSPTGND